MSEIAWWADLRGEDIPVNAWGVPHYDVEAVADFIDPIIRGTVLDLGCGPGRLGHTLARRHPEAKIYGLDISATMLEMSRKNAPDTWVPYLADGVSIPDREFDAVYCVTVFQHLEHALCVKYIEQIWERLAPGGDLMFTYAIGNEDTFLSHQTSTDLVFTWLDNAGFNTYAELITPEAHPNWNWMVARK